MWYGPSWPMGARNRCPIRRSRRAGRPHQHPAPRHVPSHAHVPSRVVHRPCTARPLESRVMEAFKQRFNRGNANVEFEWETVESIDSARDSKPAGALHVRTWPYSYIMDLTGHPAHFPQLEILRPFPALAASPSRYASVSPAWSMRKRSRHRCRRERNQSRRSNTSPHPPQPCHFSSCLIPHHQPDPGNAREDRCENPHPP
jgi:hypothetical protein